MDVTLPVMACVKQQPRRALDADIAQAEKQRAQRLTMPLDAHQFTRAVVLIDDGSKLGDIAALAVRLRASRERRGRNKQQHQADNEFH